MEAFCMEYLFQKVGICKSKIFVKNLNWTVSFMLTFLYFLFFRFIFHDEPYVKPTHSEFNHRPKIKFDKQPKVETLQCSSEQMSLEISDKAYTDIVEIPSDCQSVKFTRVTFKNCFSGSADAVLQISCNTFIYEGGSISFTTSHDSSLLGILLNQVETTEIKNVNFENCWSSKFQGSAIHSNGIDSTNKLAIDTCTFTDCGSSSIRDASSIYSTNQNIMFLQSKVIFDTVQSISGFCINAITQLLVDGCQFTKITGNMASAISYITTGMMEMVESIQIQNSNVKDCSQTRDLFSFSLSNCHPQFINIAFENIQNSFLLFSILCSFQITIDNNPIVFDSITLDQITSSNNYGGVGFYIDIQSLDEIITFENCVFTHISSTLSSGSLWSVLSFTQEVPFTIVNCRFEDCTAPSDFCPMYFSNTKNILVEDCTFKNCKSTTETVSSHSIYLNIANTYVSCRITNISIEHSAPTKYKSLFVCDGATRELIIHNCSFKDKIVIADGETPSIFSISGAQTFECVNCDFIFSSTAQSNPRAITFQSLNSFIDGCIFQNCGSSDIQGGALNYRHSTSPDTLSIKNCIFDHCIAKESSAGIFILYSGVPELYNNTFRDMSSKYTISLCFNSNVQFGTIIFEDCLFTHNQAAEDAYDGGGSGIWIDNFEADGNFYPTYLEIVNCEFTENSTPHSGGALAFGYAESLLLTKLTVIGCTFLRNTCKYTEIDGVPHGGGVIWLITSYGCRIENCTFSENKPLATSTSHGGAIFVSFAVEEVSLIITNCTFTHNSCPQTTKDIGLGHSIYTDIIYGTLVLTECFFIDEGIDQPKQNSVLYIQSGLNMNNCSILFTDKSESYSRGILIQGYSQIYICNTIFTNCTDNEKKGASIYYLIQMDNPDHTITLINNTLISNVVQSEAAELYLELDFLPEISNCEVMLDDCQSSLFVADFTKGTFPYLDVLPIDGFNFVNNSLNGNTLLKMLSHDDDIKINQVAIFNSILQFNRDFIFHYFKDAQLSIVNSSLISNSNEHSLLDVEKDIKVYIANCVFKDNRIRLNPTKQVTEISTIYTHNKELITILDTVFEYENIVHEDNPDLNGCTLNLNTDAIINNISIIDCFVSKFAILFSPIEEENHKSSLIIDNSYFDTGGGIKIAKQTEEVLFLNSTIKKSEDGFIYEPATTTDSMQTYIHGNVFEEIGQCAFRVYIYDIGSISNNTMRSCKNLEESSTSGIFEIFVQNETVDRFVFDSFVFENNECNNNDVNNERWMNGGGIGLLLEFSLLKKLSPSSTEKVDIFIDFNDCYFVSNKATKYGGAFCFIENEQNSLYFSFNRCLIIGNKCDRLKGGAIFLSAKNVSFNGCYFDSNSDLDFQSNSLQFTSDEIVENSVIFINEIKYSDFSIVGTSFTNNKASIFYVNDLEKQLLIHQCHFYQNTVAIVDFVYYQKNDPSLTNHTIANSFIITVVSSKALITISNSLFESNFLHVVKLPNPIENDGLQLKISNIKFGCISIHSDAVVNITNVNFLDDAISGLLLRSTGNVFIKNCNMLASADARSNNGGALNIKTDQSVYITNAFIESYSSLTLDRNSPFTDPSENDNPSEPFIMVAVCHLQAGQEFRIKNMTFRYNYGDLLYLACDHDIVVEDCLFLSNVQNFTGYDDIYDSNILEVKEGPEQPARTIPYYSLVAFNLAGTVQLTKLDFFNNTERPLYLMVLKDITLNDCHFDSNQTINDIFEPYHQINNADNIKAISINFCSGTVSFSNCTFNNLNASIILYIATPSSLIFKNCQITRTIDDGIPFEKILYNAIVASCKTNFEFENSLIQGYCGVYISETSFIPKSIIFSNSKMNKGRFGISFENDISKAAEYASSSISINSCNFSSFRNALSLYLFNSNFYLNNIKIDHCICNTKEESHEVKEAIFAIHCFTDLMFEFHEFSFIENRFSNSLLKGKGGGGIGLVLFQLDSKQSHKPISLSFIDCQFIGNRATSESNSNENGGAFFYDDDDHSTELALTFSRCFFEMNQADGIGGALYINHHHDLTIDMCVFTNNSAKSSDTLYICSVGNFMLTNSNFTKSTLNSELSNTQITLTHQNPDEIKIDHCLFSIINPKRPQLFLTGLTNQGQFRIVRCSFTHFFADENVDILDDRNFVHIEIDFPSVVKIDQSCFDVNGTIEVKNPKTVLTVNDENLFGNEDCVMPIEAQEIIDSLVDPINASTNETVVGDPGTDKNKKMVMIYAIVGSLAGVIIIVIILIVVYRKLRQKYESEDDSSRSHDESDEEMGQESLQAMLLRYDKPRPKQTKKPLHPIEKESDVEDMENPLY